MTATYTIRDDQHRPYGFAGLATGLVPVAEADRLEFHSKAEAADAASYLTASVSVRREMEPPPFADRGPHTVADLTPAEREVFGAWLDRNEEALIATVTARMTA